MRVEIRMAILLGVVLLILGSVVLRTCEPKSDAGEALYNENCANCHMEDGSGVEGLIPPLWDEAFLKQNEDSLACWIFMGVSGDMTINGREYNGAMPGNSKLSHAEIANIINYVKVNWAPSIHSPTEREVSQSINQCLARR